MRRLAALVMCLLLAMCLCACAAENPRRQEYLRTASLTEEQTALLGTKTVLLDAGHGYDDPGCQYPEHGIVEKELTLVLAQKIAAELEQSGITVLFTHDGQTFLPLAELDALAEQRDYDLQTYLEELVDGYSGREGQEAAATVEAFCVGMNEDVVFDTFERAYYANLLSAEQQIDLFLSVHINASATSSKAKGFDLFVCSDTPYEQESDDLMGCIQESLQHSFPSSRCGTKMYSWDNAYVVTKYVDMPALLLESGFASNAEDAKNLTDVVWQDRFARSVADGIRLFLLDI